MYMRSINHFLFCTLLLQLLSFSSLAQTTIINPATVGGFESGASFAANGWTAVNGANNNWYCGTTTTCSGTNAAYVGTAPGNNNYNNSTGVIDINHIYRDVTFPAGETVITLNFSFKGVGENSYDGIKVYLGTTASAPVAGTDFIITQPGTQIGSTWYNQQAACTSVNITIGAANAGTTKRLVFSWRNDGTLGTSPAGSLDNISLISMAPVFSGAPGGVSAGLKSWFKVNTNYISGSNSFGNSVNNINLPSISSATAPTYISSGPFWNFNPAIDFDGTSTTDHFVSDVNDIGDFMSTTNASMFSVFKDDNLAGNNHLFGYFQQHTGPSFYDEYSIQSNGVWTRKGNAVGVWVAITGIGSVPGIMATTFNSSDATPVRTYFNNSTHGTAVPTGTFNNTANRRVWFGHNGTNNCDADASEAISYNVTLSAADRKKVESYLATKYGITLGTNGTSVDYVNSNNTIYWQQSLNSGYAYDIAGVSRDDASALDQRKSHSINHVSSVFNDIITIANGNSFAAPSAFSADLSSFVWGHNGQPKINTGAIVNIPTENAQIIQTIFRRAWKAQETGTVGTMVIEVNLSAVIGTSGVSGNNDLTNLRLLIDEDGNFNTGAFALSPTSYNNGTDIAYFTYDFIPGTGSGNGFFFTLASTNYITTPLPVELTSFTTKNVNCDVVLNWQTASEKNSEKFEVYRSVDGVNWSMIASIKGKGTTQDISNYQFVDIDVPNNSIVYYQLTQYDVDGAKRILDTKAVEYYCLKNELSVYPNPSEGEFNLILNLSSSEMVEISVIDVFGKLIHTESSMFHKGENTKEINLSKLSSGIYIMKVKVNDNEEAIRVIKR